MVKKERKGIEGPWRVPQQCPPRRQPVTPETKGNQGKTPAGRGDSGKRGVLKHDRTLVGLLVPLNGRGGGAKTERKKGST